MNPEYKKILIWVGGTVLVMGLILYFALKSPRVQSIIVGASNVQVDSLLYSIKAKDKVIDSLQLIAYKNSSQVSKIVYKPVYIDKNKIIIDEAAIRKAIDNDSISPSRDVKFWKDYFSK